MAMKSIFVKHPDLAEFRPKQDGCENWVVSGYRLKIRPISGNIKSPNIASDALMVFLSNLPSSIEIEGSQVLFDDDVDDTETLPAT